MGSKINQLPRVKGVKVLKVRMKRMNKWPLESSVFINNPKGKSLLMAKYLISLVFVLGTSTLLSLAFRQLGLHEVNFALTYIVGVIVFAYLTEGLASSIIASAVAVLLFDYFFIDPYGSLWFKNSDSLVTFTLIFIAAVLSSSLTVKAKREAYTSKMHAKRFQLQYQLSQKLLKMKSIDDLAKQVGEGISSSLGLSLWIVLYKNDQLKQLYFENGKLQAGKILAAHHISEIKSVIDSPKTSLVPKRFYDDQDVYYVPVQGTSECFGVIGLVGDQESIGQEHEELTLVITNLMAVAIERERFADEKRRAAILVESEQFRANLLRAISHDLRTPLTSINGVISYIYENMDLLTVEQQKQLLKNASDDAHWLIHTVENILSLTKLEEGHFVIKTKPEYVEELLEEAIRRTEKRCQYHKVNVLLPKEPVCIYAEARLIEQVFINIIDNAVKYTPEGSKIDIVVDVKIDTIRIRFEDNGPGIPAKDFGKLFNRFYTTAETSDRDRRGIGLGLDICKSIIESHQGQISVYNNQKGGATFEIILPIRS